MSVYVITIPNWQPTPLNRLIGCHHATRGRRKAADRDMVATYARMLSVPPATDKRRVGLVVTLAPRQRGADVDAYWKSVLDALVNCRLLVDDSYHWCDMLPIRFDRADKPATRITLEDVS